MLFRAPVYHLSDFSFPSEYIRALGTCTQGEIEEEKKAYQTWHDGDWLRTCWRPADLGCSSVHSYIATNCSTQFLPMAKIMTMMITMMATSMRMVLSSTGRYLSCSPLCIHVIKGVECDSFRETNGDKKNGFAAGLKDITPPLRSKCLSFYNWIGIGNNSCSRLDPEVRKCLWRRRRQSAAGSCTVCALLSARIALVLRL